MITGNCVTESGALSLLVDVAERVSNSVQLCDSRHSVSRALPGRVWGGREGMPGLDLFWMQPLRVRW